MLRKNVLVIWEIYCRWIYNVANKLLRFSTIKNSSLYLKYWNMFYGENVLFIYFLYSNLNFFVYKLSWLQDRMVLIIREKVTFRCSGRTENSFLKTYYILLYVFSTNFILSCKFEGMPISMWQLVMYMYIVN